ncbi:PE-PPE domain protein [Mycolicibacterium rhodesiae JS60]|nr:PE-PPE domain protein [Mycolicibacterium rhodesiae JS60]
MKRPDVAVGHAPALLDDIGAHVQAVRTTVVACSVLLAVALVVVGLAVAPVCTVVAAAATTVLIMGGTGNPLSTPPDPLSYVQQYVSTAIDNYVAPSSVISAGGVSSGPYNGVAVITPESATDIGQSIADGIALLDSCLTSNACVYNEGLVSVAPTPADMFVVFGYSQSAAIATFEKAALFAEYGDGEGPDAAFVVIGNSTRPNGGSATRGAPTSASPTDASYLTVDIAQQYDGLADAPLNNRNLIAVLNAYLGQLLLHPQYGAHSLSEAGVVDQGQYGDTSYYLIPATVLPLLLPLKQLPVLGPVLADVLDPPLRVLVEAGYDRTLSPGIPTGYDTKYSPGLVTTLKNFLTAIPTGWDNGLQDVIGVRVFGTAKPGPYGVGGPPVTYLDSDAAAAAEAPNPATAAVTTITPSAVPTGGVKTVSRARSRNVAAAISGGSAVASSVRRKHQAPHSARKQPPTPTHIGHHPEPPKKPTSGRAVNRSAEESFRAG